MDDLISRQAVTDTVRKIILGFFSEDGAMNDTEKTLLSVSKAVCNGVRALPSAQPELIEQGAYVRGFEQGRTQGMIDNTIKAEWTNADALDLQPTCNQLATDYISRQAAIDALYDWSEHSMTNAEAWHIKQVIGDIKSLPSAQPEQRYTEEELRVFAHGISLSLLSKRSAQHWRYDKDTATEIEFLERLYEKVGADMRGEQECTKKI